jgi:diadenylate cyclase
MELIPSFFANMRWTDVVDIGLLWYALYRGLLLMRGTRAFQSLVGLLIALVVYEVSGWSELYAIHWMLEKFFGIIALALLILFQSDIKRALAGAGGRFFPSISSTPNPNALEEVIRASFIMASRRIGALIAIQREASLEDYAATGTRLEAQVSSELLLAIFHPTSPMHDGAVMIREGTVLSAKVFLPLSLARDLSRFYGTRHRAAIGLTEETDAVVIIVSEERGTVGIVAGGALQPVADANELREKLLETFRPSARRRSA